MIGFVCRCLVQLGLHFHHQLGALEHRLADADQVRQSPADTNAPGQYEREARKSRREYGQRRSWVDG